MPRCQVGRMALVDSATMARWQISERFFVRTSGLPFEAIELDAGVSRALADALAVDRAAGAGLEV